MALALLVISLATACQDGLPEAGVAQYQHTDQKLYFPTHAEPLGTDLGHEYLLGTLMIVEGCLKILAQWEGVDSATFNPVGLVWPAGFTLGTEGGRVSVVDDTGVIRATVGDTVRLGGRTTWSTDSREEEFLKNLPEECQGPIRLVGDEVTPLGPEEPTVLTIPGTNLWFPREKSARRQDRVFKAALFEGVIALPDNCLRLNGKDGAVIIWPPGFTPHLKDGVVEVRNGGGRTVARVGDTIRMGGGGGPKSSGPCSGGTFEDTRIIE